MSLQRSPPVQSVIVDSQQVHTPDPMKFRTEQYTCLCEVEERVVTKTSWAF